MWHRIRIILTICLIGWLIIAQGCMRFRMTDAKAKKEFRKKGIELRTSSILTEGKHVHYAMAGHDSMPTLVLIHGTPGSWTAFEDYLKDSILLSKVRLVAIDRPGFGYSDFGKPLRLPDQSRFMLNVIDSLQNGRPFFLAGHSLGGPVVVRMAADRPATFKAIMLLSASVDPDLEPREKWRNVMGVFPLRYLLPGAFRPSNTELIWFKKDILDLSGQFEKITSDVYLVHGDADKWVPVGNVDHAISKLSSARSVEKLIIPEGNHFIPWTYRMEVRTAMLKMLAGEPIR
jgi:pimeloyl-ACP methyl ester carboxylesterase